MFTKTKFLLAGIFIAIFGVLFSLTINIPNNLEPHDSDFSSIEHPANINASMNKCGSIFYFKTAPIWFGTIPENYGKPVPTAPMNLPAYGYMDEQPFDMGHVGVYPKTFEGFPETTIYRALWEGVTIIWYNPAITDSNYQAIEVIALNKIQAGQKLMVLPYNIELKQIPLERNFATSAWGVTQSCLIFNEDVYDEFAIFKDTVYSERNMQSPPVASFDETGALREIKP